MGLVIMLLNLMAQLIGWVMVAAILIIAVIIALFTGGIALIGYVFVSLCILFVKWDTRRRLNSRRT